MKRMRDKFEDEKRKETEKYQFEYDKLREEIQLFARKLGQEENLNKQLSMLNYKLQANVTELGHNFGGREDDYSTEIGGGRRPAFEIDNDVNEEIFNRKKAWAELEREQDEVKSNIKQLMRKAPESNELDNPLMADRLSPKESKQRYRVPQDVILEQQHQTKLDSVVKERPKSTDKAPTASAKIARENSNEQLSNVKLTKDRSNEDLSLSSQSKAH